jgi:hypothetical protein
MSLDAAGRLASFLYFLGAVVLGIKTLRLLLPDDRRVGLIFAIVALASPQYLFWGRAFLIETCAVFWCLLFLYAAMRFMRRPSTLLFAAMIAGSVLGALAKATTWPAFALAFALYWLVMAIGQRRIPLAASAGVMIAGVAAIAAVSWWNGYADALKAQSVFGNYVSSKNLVGWNFGALADRFDPALWTSLLPKRMAPEAIGSYWPVLLVALAFAARAGANIAVGLAGAALYVAAILLFTNLHMVHPYYQTANAIFLIAGAAALVGGAMKGRRGVVVAFFCLAVLAGGAWRYFAKERLPFITRDVAADPSYGAALAAREMVAEGRSLYVFGYEWSSEVHYYAQRKGIAFFGWMRQEDLQAALDAPADFVGDAPLGGVVDCRAAKRPYANYGAAMNAAIDAFLARLMEEGARSRRAGGCDVFAIKS